MKNLLIGLCLASLIGCGTSSGIVAESGIKNVAGEFIFPDPVVYNFADPFVLTASDGFYYMYGTVTDGGGIYVTYRSADLKKWENMGSVFSTRRDNWAYKDFWAPEVVERGGLFYMFYTARQKETDRLHIGLAVSDHPLGPFVDTRNAPLLGLDYANIDAHVFTDDDGRTYMYYSRDISENPVGYIRTSDIYAVELNRNNFEPIAKPVFIFTPEQEWETLPIQRDHYWNEGPGVVKIDNIYYMTYSGNPFFSFEYAIGLATATSPLGPWVKCESNPMVQGSRGQGISGPGHNCVFKSHDGQDYYIAYHVHKDPTVGGGARNILVSQVVFENGIMMLLTD